MPRAVPLPGQGTAGGRRSRDGYEGMYILGAHVPIGAISHV